jgi:hypothetical protein
MADYPSTQYGPKSAGAAGGAAGGGLPIAGSRFTGINGLIVDVSQVTALGLDPCVVNWDNPTLGGLFQVQAALAEYPADATSFTVTIPSGAGTPQPGLSLTDYVQNPDFPTVCGTDSTLVYTIEIEDGTSAGAIIENYLLHGDASSICPGCAP